MNIKTQEEIDNLSRVVFYHSFQGLDHEESLMIISWKQIGWNNLRVLLSFFFAHVLSLEQLTSRTECDRLFCG
ncbi:hypothetical protein C0J52_15444 [Blattella germanica]|nr:hypothetical protein C0J52_15444 [Blattella germanica]